MAEGTASELKKLLPHGHIELRFRGQRQLDAADTLLKSYSAVRDNDAHSLTITTDGTVAHIVRIFNRIEAAHIEVAEFSQKLPTLDDAFLKIISDNEEKR